jgi:tetratricopeptide (TPR) repeat protein
MKTMNRFAFVAGLLSVATFAPIVASSADATADAYQKGILSLKKLDYDSAIASFSEAIQLNPKYSLAYNNRGTAYEGKRDYGKAIADYTEALRLDPQFVSAYCNRGLARRHQGDFKKAIVDYSAAIRLDPQHENAYYGRGVANDKNGEHDKAIADFTESIRINPKSYRAIFWRGIAHAEKDDPESAIADYNRALAINPNDAIARCLRGNALGQRGNYEKAIADYKQAIVIDSKCKLAYQSLAWLQATCPDEKYRDGEKAVENASKAYQLTGGNSWAYLDALAAAYAEIGDFGAAKQWQEKTIEMSRADKSVTEKGRQELRSRLELYKQGRPFRGDRRLRSSSDVARETAKAPPQAHV